MSIKKETLNFLYVNLKLSKNNKFFISCKQFIELKKFKNKSYSKSLN